jgi:hypothetical protein
MGTADRAPARWAWSGLRLATAAAIVAAIAVTLSASREAWAKAAYADLGALWVNFFSYFTVLSNLAAAVVLTVGAVAVVRLRGAEPAWWSQVRICVAVYMGITGLVYNLLLRGIAVTGGGDTPEWPNEVLHVIGPLVLVLDWLFAPGRTPIAWKRIGVILAFPIVWTAYTLIRGPHVVDQVRGRPTWYPYPFLDPDNGGYLAVSGWVVLIAAAFAGVAALLIWSSRRW